MLRRAMVVGLLSVMVGGCGQGVVDVDGQGDNLGMSWEQFLKVIYQEPATGVFIVDGDTPIADPKQLREFYETYAAPGAPLIIHQNGGVDAKWTDTQKVNLTYCVSSTFGSNQAAVIQAMADAGGAWTAATNVAFVHVAAQDSSCTSSNANVLFDVNPVNAGGQYLARSFFPGQSRSTRNVLIDSSSFSTSPPLTLTGILRHELGHVLGFRHEHTRPEAGTCFEDNNWRVLTPYDSASVMHYPQCNGTGDWSLTLTSYDKQGAVSVYGTPGGGTPPPPPPPPPPPSGTTTETFSGSVAQGASKYYGPFAVTSGTTFTAAMTGSGDPDLYVRWNAQPTTSTYTCRPYLTGATETCTLTVPSTASSAYIMIRGYASGTYNLTVTYVKNSAPPPSGTPKTATYSGSVAKGQNAYHGPLSVVAGTSFKVVMSGTGDPDLYVRFGSSPTLSAYDCRPYIDGASETCTLTVPSGQSSAYLMVNGYLAGTYTLNVNYTSP